MTSLLAVILGIHVSLQIRDVGGVYDCTTTIGGPSVDAPCQFPFIFRNRVFYDCTNEDDLNDPNHPLWCSTKVDVQRVHIGGRGHWGYCDARCQIFIFSANFLFNNVKNVTSCDEQECVDYKKCPEAVQKIQEFSKNYDPNSFLQLGRKVCNVQERRICCVQMRNDTPPSPSTTEAFSVSTVSPSMKGDDSIVFLNQEELNLLSNNSESGRWLPSPERAECSRDISFKKGFIVSGNKTSPGEFPHSALLGYWFDERNRTEYLCGGTLINRKYVVTAAHCHDNRRPSESIREVVLGEWDVSVDPDCPKCGPVQRFKIADEDVIKHENWNIDEYLSTGNDISIIRLPRLAITFAQNPTYLVQPICLDWRPYGSKESILAQSSNEYLVTGWGRSTRSHRLTQDYLEYGVLRRRMLKIRAKIVEKKACLDYKDFKVLANNHMCAAGVEGSDSCKGDSGGPLIKRRHSEAQMFLKGIVAFGTKICGTGVPGVYTNIEFYIKWIINQLKD